MTPRARYWLLCAVAVVAAMGWAWALRWSCDDATISFRYAEHFVQGHGLVFNLDPAEAPVEGYSNFAWVMLLALGAALGFSGDAMEGWASALGALCHGATVLLLAVAGFRAMGTRAIVPLAACGWAALHHAASLAPAGLETALFTLLLTAMAVVTVGVRCPRGAAWLGWLGVLAAMTRPDGALPCAVSGAFLLWDALRQGRWRSVVAFALPFVVVFVPFLLWRRAFYGQWVPNTFFAKSGGDPYPGQGLQYLLDYVTIYWPLLPAALLLVLALLRRPSPVAKLAPWSGRRAALVLLAHVVPYVLFVVWVGGDFMFARFLLPVTPLVLLGCDLAAARLRPPVVLAMAAVLVGGLLLRPQPAWLGEYDHTRNPRGYSDNRLITMKEIAPGVPIAEAARFAGHYLRGLFEGLDVRVGIAGSHANLAWRSRVPVAVECASGLTDAHIAHLPVPDRGQPGHERNYTLYPGYLQRRGVHFMFELSFHTGSSADPYRDIFFPAIPARIVVYDRTLLAELKRRDPNVRFADFEAVLDQYLAEMPGKDKAVVARDLVGFRDYYFDHNDDPERLRAFEEFLAR